MSDRFKGHKVKLVPPMVSAPPPPPPVPSVAQCKCPCRQQNNEE